MPKTRKKLLRLCFLAGLLGGQVHANLFQIDIDTSFLADPTSVDLTFDFFDGGPPSNSVTISNFVNSIGPPSSSPVKIGNVMGDFLISPGIVELNDYWPVEDSFYNEYLQNITLGGTGSALTFRFSISGNAPAVMSFPDQFSLYFLKPGEFDLITGLQQSLIDTDGPGDALLVYNIATANQPEVYSPSSCPQDVECVRATDISGSNGIPEPGILALTLAGLLALGFARSVRRYPLRRELAS